MSRKIYLIDKEIINDDVRCFINMTCYHPIRALVVGTTDSGAKKLKFVGKDYDNEFAGKPIYEELLLPCGKCIGCTVERSRQWATRMMLELMYHEKACFVTLTYNDENVPMSAYQDDEGKWHDSMSLHKPDLQKFMKRLRRYYERRDGEKIRFYACGEYGSKTRRPHYHAILYGVDFSENRELLAVKDGFAQYRSEILERLWPFGFSMICDVSWNTCAYVSRYCTKKYYGRRNIYYQTFNIVPEFNVMSRRPGLGAKYFEEHGNEVYINQEIWLSNNKGALKVRPPAYFDKLYEIEHPEEMEAIKEKRKELAENAMALKLENTDLDMYEQLLVEEKVFKERIKSLKREKV